MIVNKRYKPKVKPKVSTKISAVLSAPVQPLNEEKREISDKVANSDNGYVVWKI